VDLDGLFFAFVVANLADSMLARACGGEAQAVALVDSWITELVRDRARAAVLHLDLSSLTGLRLLFSFGLGLGLPRPGRPARAAQARVRLQAGLRNRPAI